MVGMGTVRGDTRGYEGIRYEGGQEEHVERQTGDERRTDDGGSIYIYKITLLE